MAATPFLAYPSIENDYRDKFVSRIRENFIDVDWVATEKCHGSNYSAILTTDPTSKEISVVYAKRSGPLGVNEKFFNHEVVDGLHRGSFKLLYQDLDGEREEDEKEPITLQIFGEIYGGIYEGVKSKYRNVVPVQKEVQYSPHPRFIVFDVVVNKKYLDYDRVIAVCERAFLPCVPISKRGTLDELLGLDPVFITRLADRGLKPIDKNFAEGYVLRPNKTAFIDLKGNVTSERGEHHPDRIILKKKNPAFLERKAPAPEVKPTKPGKTGTLTEEESLIVDLAARYVCASRLDNCVSKSGTDPSDPKMHGILKKELMNDAFDEFAKDYPEVTENEFLRGKVKCAMAKAANDLLELSVASRVQPDVA